MKNSNLLHISPIDGRYKNQTKEISAYFSEYAYLKYRLEVEIKYLIALSKIGIIRKINLNEKKTIIKIVDNFNLKEAGKIKKIEEKTHHDVKSIEYYLKEKLSPTTLSDISVFIHFGLTSEDTNNIAQRLMIKDSLIKVLLPNIINLNKELSKKSKEYKKITMLARTHGQPAVPTTLGKEILVFQKRLNSEIEILKKQNFKAKINGAVGNYNALYFVFPKTNWLKFSKNLLKQFDLDVNPITTQIAPYEDIIYFFQTIQRINGIILDFDQDMWRYISDGYFIQENKKNEVGSSTMPQKINPILFENSEGNLILANSLISGFVDKLPLSRLQRDLSGSTIFRNFGVALAYSLIAYKNTFLGLQKVKPDFVKIKKDLNEDWSILSEAVQIYLKREGINDGYEIIKKFTRGEKMNNEEFQKMINKLPLNENQKTDLKKLKPENHIGIY